MPAFLLDILVALLWVGGGILIALLSPVLAQRLIQPDLNQSENGYRYSLPTRELGQTVGYRVSALYGVILALVYSQELGGYGAVRDGVYSEAVHVASVWNDAERYGGPAAPVIRSALREYVAIVVDEEWRLLRIERQLSDRAWAARERAVEVALDLEPASARETWLRQHMLDNLAEVSRLRHLRAAMVGAPPPAMFWVPAIAGLVLVSVPFFIFAPTRVNRLLMASFGAFAGLILFFIAAFSNPFRPPFPIPADPFSELLATTMAPTAGREIR